MDGSDGGRFSIQGRVDTDFFKQNLRVKRDNNRGNNPA
jgi:hypothetical protein